jgi:YfiH family protein
MPFFQTGSIKYFKFSSLEGLGVYHAVFTRHGGLSPYPWKSLNFGASVGDDVERVKKNREKALLALGIDPTNVYDTYQVHSVEIVTTDKALPRGEPHKKADGIVTNTPRLTLMMRFADCVPVLFVDPVARAIGIVHAGWLGTVNKIVAKAVSVMVEMFKTDPRNIVAAIGPSIGPDHYPVGIEVVEKVRSSFGEKAQQMISYKNRDTYLDLWKANQVVLDEMGVINVEIAGICTHCHVDDWYSHRCEHGKTGRFGIILGLE